MGSGVEDDRKVLILSDQNFPAALPVSDGLCISVLRIEHSALSELSDMAAELLRSGSLPKGSLVMIVSVSHLARVGTATYCQDLVTEILKLKKN